MTFQNTTNRKIISACLIVAILAPLFLLSRPEPTEAQSIILDAICVKGGLTGAISGALGTATNVSAVPVKDRETNAYTKITAAQAAEINSVKCKEWRKKLFEEILKAFARRLLAKMTQATINWINSGFHGSPLFLERPDAFFKDIAKYEIRNLVQLIGYDSIRQPFGKSVAISIINKYKRPFERNAQYSLSRIVRDPELLRRYRNDFRVGGWDGWLINTQYPQNDYVGYRGIVADELGRRLEGTNQNNAQKIKTALDQGSGFLSPQTCPDNPKYNSLKNQFRQPTFKFKPYEPPDCEGDFENSRERAACIEAQNEYNVQYELDRRVAYNEWSIENACPGGLVSTTPGSVVANEVMTALSSKWRETELALALGNSLSAILDALLNKLFSSGLNALSNKISGGGRDDDNFDYYGHTLGSPRTGNRGVDWSGPDEEIILSDFKREVQNAIENGNKELRYIDNADVNAPGFLQIFDTVILRTQELDTCLPGPNFGWEERVDREAARNTNNANTATIANSYKNALPTRMKNELPGGAEYLSAVHSIRTTNEKRDILIERESKLREILVTLQSISTGLSNITAQPAPGGAAEANLVRLRERFNEILVELPSNGTVANAQNRVDDLKDQLNNAGTLTAKCTTERTQRGWSNPGGAESTSPAGTEKNIFCTAFVGTTLNCDVIYKTSATDYKISNIVIDNSLAPGGVDNPNTTNTPTLGTCLKGILIQKNKTQAECSAIGGAWTPNPSTGQ